MLEFENTRVYGICSALMGMRNPLESWARFDSEELPDGTVHIGNNDLELARKLIKAGSEHRKFLRQIFVSVDITAPRYWWQEFDTYKIGTAENSCSTMHKLASKEIALDMFERDMADNVTELFWREQLIPHLNDLRNKYIETGDMKYFRALKQMLPESFIQKRTVTMNFENLYCMYQQRKHHRLSEWSVNFVNWVKSIPHAEELFQFSKESKPILLLCGESGAGKTSVAEGLEEKGLKILKSYTTRPPREGDTSHTFVSDEEFDKILAHQSVVAFTDYGDYRYCATEEQVNQSDVYVIDVAGIEYFREHYKGYRKPLAVYIYAPEKIRYERMLQRGDSPKQAANRLAYDAIVFRDIKNVASTMVENDSLPRCVDTVYKLYREKERCE